MRIIGKRYTRLVVIKKTDKKLRREFLYECKCDCGNTVYQTRQALEIGHATSCGCLHKENFRGIRESLYKDGTKLSAFNDKAFSTNKLGVRGVSSYIQSGRTKYMARLVFKGKTYAKKGFATIDEAHEYRKYLERKYLG